MDPVGMNRPEVVSEALGGTPADPVGLADVGVEVAAVPEQEAETRAMHKIASIPGMARDAGTIPALLCPSSICDPPSATRGRPGRIESTSNEF
jgi:hypothetical protein